MLKDLAALIKAVAWPTVTLVALFVLLPQVKVLLQIIAAKIDRATKFKFKGLEIAEEVARASIRSVPEPQPLTPEERTQKFDDLAHAYDVLNIADYSQRVAERSRLADSLAQIALQLKLSRADLAELGSEGKLVALASMIVLKPLANDLTALEKAARTAEFRFTRYRIALALLPTLAKPAVSAATLQRATRILDSIENRDTAPDASLQSLIDKLRAQIAQLYENLA